MEGWNQSQLNSSSHRRRSQGLESRPGESDKKYFSNSRAGTEYCFSTYIQREKNPSYNNARFECLRELEQRAFQDHVTQTMSIAVTDVQLNSVCFPSTFGPKKTVCSKVCVQRAASS